MILEIKNRATLCMEIPSKNNGISEVLNNKDIRSVGAISNQEGEGGLAHDWELLTTNCANRG